MGLIRTKIELSNPRRENIKPFVVECLADTGVLHLCLPEQIALQLELEHYDDRPVTFANGETKMCKYMGPICVRWEKRVSITGAMILGDEVLLGAIPMDDMDLVLIPSQLKIEVNPMHPNFSASVAK